MQSDPKMCDALQLNWKLNPNVKNSKKSTGSQSCVKQALSHSNTKVNGRKGNCDEDYDQEDEEDGSSSSKSYTLRACSIQKRMETEHRKTLPRKRGPKPRPKTLPMSKYRRKTANMRERQRMGEINTAFERLRDKIPNPVLSGRGKCEKLTKINILHVTINYIRAMENLLNTGDSGIRSFSEMVRNPIRPNEKPNKFENAVFEGEMDGGDYDSEAGSPTMDRSIEDEGSGRKKAPRRPPKKADKTKSTQKLPGMSSSYPYGSQRQDPQTSSTCAPGSFSSTFNFSPTTSATSSDSSSTYTPIKSCFGTSSPFSDSGVSSLSSAEPSPSQSSRMGLCPLPSDKMDQIDPLLGSTFLNGVHLNRPPVTSTSMVTSTPLKQFQPFEVTEDDLLKDVAGFVDSLDGTEFPDITFDDPFEFFPKTMS